MNRQRLAAFEHIRMACPPHGEQTAAQKNNHGGIGTTSQKERDVPTPACALDSTVACVSDSCHNTQRFGQLPEETGDKQYLISIPITTGV